MNREREYEHDDEISIYDLWLILRNRWSTVLIVTLVTVGLAVLYAYFSPKVYRVHNILMFNQLQDGEPFVHSELAATVSILEKLKKLPDLTEPEKQKVLNMLGMHEGDLKNIVKISSSDIKGSTALWVDIDTTDSKAGVSLMEALPGFVLSNPSISDKLRVQRALLLKNRDDLKAIIDNPTRNLRLSRDAVIYLPSIDLFALQERYNRINTILERIDKSQIISLAWKTELPTHHYKPKMKKTGIISLALGFILGILSAFTVEWVTKENLIRSHDHN